MTLTRTKKDGMGGIILGDCLEVMKGFADNQFDLVLTDPPYGISVAKTGAVGGGSHRGKARQFDKSDWDNERLVKEYFDEMFRISKNQIIFGGNYYLDYLPATRCMVVWYKREGLPKRTFADCEIAWTSFDKNSAVFSSRWDGFIRDGNEDREAHPTQKPERLMKWCVSEFTKEGDSILDPFAGSGSTLRAAKDLNRPCTVIEINPKYVEIIRKRERQEILL